MTMFNPVNLNTIPPEQGRILISEPFMNDPYFSRSVVLITEHTDTGSLGLILNKPVSISLNEVLDDFPEYSGKIYLGGPVRKNNLFFIHTLGDKIPGSIEISHGLFWGGDFETVKTLISCNVIKDNEIRFFAGYSGWTPDQLSQEITERNWFVSKATPNLLLNQEEGNTKWSHILRDMGHEFAVMANFPVDPNLN